MTEGREREIVIKDLWLALPVRYLPGQKSKQEPILKKNTNNPHDCRRIREVATCTFVNKLVFEILFCS